MALREQAHCDQRPSKPPNPPSFRDQPQWSRSVWVRTTHRGLPRVNYSLCRALRNRCIKKPCLPFPPLTLKKWCLPGPCPAHPKKRRFHTVSSIAASASPAPPLPSSDAPSAHASASSAALIRVASYAASPSSPSAGTTRRERPGGNGFGVSGRFRLATTGGGQFKKRCLPAAQRPKNPKKRCLPSRSLFS